MSAVKWSQPQQTSHHVKNLLPTWCLPTPSHPPPTPLHETGHQSWHNWLNTGFHLSQLIAAWYWNWDILGPLPKCRLKTISPHIFFLLCSPPPPPFFLHYYFFHIPFPEKDTCLIKYRSHCFAPAASSRGYSWGIVSYSTQALRRDLVTGHTKDYTPTISFKELLYKPPHLLFISLFYNTLFSINVENFIPNKLS